VLAAVFHGAANAKRKAPVLPIAVVTAIASAFTYPGWVHLEDGPKTASVFVQQVRCKQHGSKGRGPCIVSELVLADGRTLLADVETTRGMNVPSARTILTIDDVVIDAR
jgi:hypothetical protein